MTTPVDLAVLFDPLATLVAAFAGAWLAFKFERRHKTEAEKGQRIAAGNRALYTLFNIWNVQEQFRKEIIEPYRGKEDAWLNMAATVPSKYGLHTFDAEALSFLLEVDAELYSSLMLEEQRFDFAVQLVAQRSQLVLGSVFPRLAQANIAVGTTVGIREMEVALGTDVVHKLKILSEGLTTNISENLQSIEEVHDKLRDVLKRLYPEQKFVKVQFHLDQGAAT